MDACLRLGDRLISPKLAHCSHLQSFYGRQAVALQLKQQEKGRQFLRLAIALIASIGVKGTAAVLAKLFERQDGPQASVAASSAIEELLPANEFRAKAQFRSEVSEWQAALERRSHHGPGCKSEPKRNTGTGRTSAILAETCPDEDSLVSLMDVLCKVIKRGGRVKIFATSCWPWVMALLEWLLGPPLGAVAGKHRFRCQVSVLTERTSSDEMNTPDEMKSLRIVYRKETAGVTARAAARSTRANQATSKQFRS
ncbi:hypothetical protein BBAD15_g11222 [Beauveria bassiana D1-5]|uniref:Uncharacterized protein n=1 Tax=Beauveria bassiana D1-5 TaxID=1245745 RepID=A0A0A2V7R9_BEABA|nr:hypothetical protein BBAD15_g11222 [Beauveria bassiana D1-5]